MSFADNLNYLMEKTGTTAYRLAKSVGAHQTSVANWKNGINMPRLEMVEKIADYFGVPVSYFSEEDQETEKSPAPDKGTEDFARYFAMLTPEHQQQIRAAMAELIKEQLQG